MTTAAKTKEEEKVWIPEITDERLDELFDRIKPVVKFKLRGLCYIQPVDLRSIAYTWSPKSAGKAPKLEPICDITTYHSYGSYNLFKPSIAEVLAQIPDEHLENVVAFEIVERPVDADDLNCENEALNAGYHVATTRLYTRK